MRTWVTASYGCSTRFCAAGWMLIAQGEETAKKLHAEHWGGDHDSIEELIEAFNNHAMSLVGDMVDLIDDHSVTLWTEALEYFFFDGDEPLETMQARGRWLLDRVNNTLEAV